MSILPPRLVIYYNDGSNPIGLAGIANLPYTDVIIGFMYPDNNFNLYGDGGAFDDNLQSNIRALQQAGKNVLISLGGSNRPGDVLSSAYQYWAQNAQNTSDLVAQIVNNFVIKYGFNGVDIDYEDDAGFTGTYNGIQFLSQLTTQLYQALLPSGQNIITHAPSTPFWDPNYDNGPYVQLWQLVGNQIAWINNQFYDNPDWDKDAATKVLWYQRAAAITGPEKLLVGALVAPTGDEGYITTDDLIQNVITPLQGQFGSHFGGVMGWEFSLDQGGNWAREIWSALTATTPAATLTPLQYTVRSGDTFSTIAQQFYGDSTLWPLIQAANPGAVSTNLQVGQQLQIPFGQQYTVQSGDQFNTLAQRFYNNNSWWPAIQDANPGTNPNNIQIGQLLQIPFGLQYTIQSGDTFSTIAQKVYGDSTLWPLIQAANPGVVSTNLQVGQQLLIQFKQQYVVQSGDTLKIIAEKFYGNGSQSTLIQNANPGVNPNDLQIGQELQIPAT